MFTAIETSSHALAVFVVMTFIGITTLIVLGAILLKTASSTKKLVEQLLDGRGAEELVRPSVNPSINPGIDPDFVPSINPSVNPSPTANPAPTSAECPALHPATSTPYPAAPVYYSSASDALRADAPFAASPATISAPIDTPYSGDFNSAPRDASPARTTFETWAGKNVIGIIASVLMFLGLAFLGVTIVPQLADWMKVALLYMLSILLTAGGSALTVFRKNNFTAAVMGCGVGSLFISIFITHLYFKLIGDVAAFALVLVWMALCLALMRKTSSLLLAVVLQIGLAVSVCLGYWGDADGSRLVLIVGYQLAASVIVIIGNSRFNQGTYWASIVLAMALSLVASWFIWDYFGLSHFGWSERYAPFEPIAAFGIQFASTTVLFGLLTAETLSLRFGAFSLANVHDAVSKGTESRKVKSCAPLAAAAAIWVTAVFIDVTCAASKCIRIMLHPVVHNLDSYLASHLGAAAGFACIALAAFLFALLERKLSNTSENQTLRPVINWLLVGSAFVASVPAVSAIGMFNVAPLTWLWTSALCALAVDSIAAARGHHASDADCEATTRGDCAFDADRVAAARGHHAFAIACVIIDSLYCGFVAFPLFVHIGLGGAATLGMAYFVALFGLALWIVHRAKPQPPAFVALAAGTTVLAMSYLVNCTPLISEGYQWSIWCMICALVCIIAGFRFDIGGVRLFGIVVVLASVIKLAVLDVAYLDSMARVVAFIVGGLICFAISALYNFARKRLE